MIKLFVFASMFVCTFYVWGETQNRWARLIMLAMFAALVYKLSTTQI